VKREPKQDPGISSGGQGSVLGTKTKSSFRRDTVHLKKGEGLRARTTTKGEEYFDRPKKRSASSSFAEVQLVLHWGRYGEGEKEIVVEKRKGRAERTVNIKKKKKGRSKGTQGS